MHDQPEPTPQEQQDAPERQEGAEEQRGPVPADPDLPVEEIHDA